ncbi:hypothetical protein LX32DRAFT_596517 [Colletotrichum zoysiae]|uniref:Uncharacterized protein n=1 Tax=Colletotrichum zoysiae TaxID=1216348 RepID=A0AAD9M1F0_9PEZI|nr:hypothetical protein LX32DRAFT_596517 [Colletotrichum zoysiae]
MQATRLRLPQRAAPLARRYIGTRGSQPAQAASERPRTVNRVPFPDFVPGPVLLKRIGRCIAFGCDPRQTADAAALVRAVVDDWAGIEMALARCGTSGTLVAHRRTLLPAKDASPGGDESGLLPWKALYMREQLSRLAFEAMTGFLDHAAATAAPEFKWLWRALRTKDTRRSPGVLAITAVNLNFAPVRPPPPIYITTLGLGSHSAYVRLESCSLPDDSDDPRSPGSLVFRVFIRSSIRMTVMANATIHASLYCDVLRRRIIPTTIAPELRRVALLERSAHVEAGRQRRALMAAIEKLERETWNRDDAVEDLGSASSA